MIPTFANLDALLYTDSVNITTSLSQHIQHRVQWKQTIDQMYNGMGCRVFVEIGYSAIISNLLKRQYNNIKLYTLRNILDIENFLNIEFWWYERVC